MVLSGQTQSSFFSGPLPPKSYPQKTEFPISRFNVKNSVSYGHVTNPLSPVKAKKVPSTQNSIIQKNNFDSVVRMCFDFFFFFFFFFLWVWLWICDISFSSVIY